MSCRTSSSSKMRKYSMSLHAKTPSVGERPLQVGAAEFASQNLCTRARFPASGVGNRGLQAEIHATPKECSALCTSRWPIKCAQLRRFQRRKYCTGRCVPIPCISGDANPTYNGMVAEMFSKLSSLPSDSPLSVLGSVVARSEPAAPLGRAAATFEIFNTSALPR